MTPPAFSQDTTELLVTGTLGVTLLTHPWQFTALVLMMTFQVLSPFSVKALLKTNSVPEVSVNSAVNFLPLGEVTSSTNELATSTGGMLFLYLSLGVILIL